MPLMPHAGLPTGPDRTNEWAPIFHRHLRARQFRLRPRSAIAVLRAERLTIRELARRTDIALRTLAARRIAADASAWASRHSRLTTTQAVIASLQTRATWTHVGGQEVAYTFGARRRIIRIPIAYDIRQVAAMIARTEVRILLGDAPAPLIAHLQAFAESELGRLNVVSS